MFYLPLNFAITNLLDIKRKNGYNKKVESII